LFARAAASMTWQGICGIVLAFLYSWGFLHPRRRLEKLSRRGWNVHVRQENLLRLVLMNNIPWVLFICFLWLVPEWLIYGFNVPVYLHGTEILVTVAIVLDIYDRIRKSASAGSPYVKIGELHDVYDAQMVKNHLEAEGIECHIQGFYYRSLLYFFGPYIELSVMVHEDKIEQARSLINNYHGGVGLLRYSS